jgi:Glyoxalase/Bleomycin resistance protein/Dioxygenase superfamily
LIYRGQRIRQTGAAVTASPAFDHIALAVPNLDEQVERLTSALGMVVRLRFPGFAVIVDPGTDVKFELSASDDGEVHVRHLGFRADDVDAAHATLVATGMDTSAAPHRQDFASMYTSSLQEPGCVEVQLVKYDD